MFVEMLHVLLKHGRGVALIDDQVPVEEFAVDSDDEAFGDRVARGARTGDLMIWMSVTVNTAPKAAVNLARGRG